MYSSVCSAQSRPLACGTKRSYQHDWGYPIGIPVRERVYSDQAVKVYLRFQTSRFVPIRRSHQYPYKHQGNEGWSLNVNVDRLATPHTLDGTIHKRLIHQHHQMYTIRTASCRPEVTPLT